MCFETWILCCDTGVYLYVITNASLNVSLRANVRACVRANMMHASHVINIVIFGDIKGKVEQIVRGGKQHLPLNKC